LNQNLYFEMASNKFYGTQTVTDNP